MKFHLFSIVFLYFQMKRRRKENTPVFNQIIFNLFVMGAFVYCVCVCVCGQNTIIKNTFIHLIVKDHYDVCVCMLKQNIYKRKHNTHTHNIHTYVQYNNNSITHFLCHLNFGIFSNLFRVEY